MTVYRAHSVYRESDEPRENTSRTRLKLRIRIVGEQFFVFKRVASIKTNMSEFVRDYLVLSNWQSFSLGGEFNVQKSAKMQSSEIIKYLKKKIF